MAWPVVLKLKYPKIYEGILKGDINAHKGAVELLQTLNAHENYHFWAKKYFLPYHIVKANEKSKLTEEQAQDLERYKPSDFHNGDPMLIWLKCLDIAQG